MIGSVNTISVSTLLTVMSLFLECVIVFGFNVIVKQMNGRNVLVYTGQTNYLLHVYF